MCARHLHGLCPHGYRCAATSGPAGGPNSRISGITKYHFTAGANGVETSCMALRKGMFGGVDVDGCDYLIKQSTQKDVAEPRAEEPREDLAEKVDCASPTTPDPGQAAEPPTTLLEPPKTPPEQPKAE